jgi:hypothetical protein
MAKNPAEEYLLQKKAFNFNSMAAKAKPYAGRAAESVGMGVATGVGGAAFAGLALAAGKLFDAATKTRDFNNMLEANPDLHEVHQADPVSFNRMFTSFRTMAPEITREPVTAGAYMRKAMVEQSPETAGFLPLDAAERGNRTQRKPGPVTEAAMGGFGRGMGFERKPSGTTKTTTRSEPDPSGAVTEVQDTANRY